MAIPTRSTLDDGRGWNVADAPQVKRRALGCGAALLLLFGVLVARLWYLQVVRGPELLRQAQSHRLQRVPIAAPRGLILDRHGRVLATSRAQHSVALVPLALPSLKRAPQDRARILSTLGFLLNLNPSEIEAQLRDASRFSPPAYPVKIAENVDLRTVTLIEENISRLNSGRTSVIVTNDLARFYPNGSLACQVLGYTGNVDADELERNRREREERETQFATVAFSPDANKPQANKPEPRELFHDDIVGKSGLEREYDHLLYGRRGADIYEVDNRNRPVRKRGQEREKPGQTLKLTLDAKLQRAAEEALSKARNSGAAVALDPRDGSVLAMASRPGFDPNIWSLSRKPFAKAYLKLARDAKHPLINRAVTSRFPPGSTFKMITASAGLERGTLRPAQSHACNGGLRMGRWFGCWTTHGSANLDVALAKSCDVYFYQEALKLGDPEGSGPDYLANIARRFGIGSRTGIDLPSDNAGLMPDTAWRARVNKGRPDLARWFPGNTLNTSIGQGDVLTTPLQMAMATSAVANGGTLWKPHLLGATIDPATGRATPHKPESTRVGVRREHLELVRQGMRSVVTNGTGKPAALDHVEVAGKTGSAEDDANGTAHAWFVCFAPYKNPRIAIAVIVENSGHGSENAAPVARAILEAAFPAPKEKP